MLQLDYVPRKRQRVTGTVYDLVGLELTGVTARGRRLAPKPVGRIKRLTRADAEAHRESADPAGVAGGDAEDDEDQLDLFDGD